MNTFTKSLFFLVILALVASCGSGSATPNPKNANAVVRTSVYEKVVIQDEFDSLGNNYLEVYALLPKEQFGSLPGYYCLYRSLGAGGGLSCFEKSRAELLNLLEIANVKH